MKVAEVLLTWVRLFFFGVGGSLYLSRLTGRVVLLLPSAGLGDGGRLTKTAAELRSQVSRLIKEL
jgi:hypothetical protein